jgi:hypothetical protein
MPSRAELIRAYKETPRPMGVYCVRNLRSGRTLVARSRNVHASLNRERAALRFGAHGNAELQRDWTALGADAFAFEVLDTLTPPEDRDDYDPTEDLLVLESMWLERLQPDGVSGYAASPAVRQGRL